MKGLHPHRMRVPRGPPTWGGSVLNLVEPNMDLFRDSAMGKQLIIWEV